MHEIITLIVLAITVVLLIGGLIMVVDTKCDPSVQRCITQETAK